MRECCWLMTLGMYKLIQFTKTKADVAEVLLLQSKPTSPKQPLTSKQSLFSGVASRTSARCAVTGVLFFGGMSARVCRAVAEQFLRRRSGRRDCGWTSAVRLLMLGNWWWWVSISLDVFIHTSWLMCWSGGFEGSILPIFKLAMPVFDFLRR